MTQTEIERIKAECAECLKDREEIRDEHGDLTVMECDHCRDKMNLIEANAALQRQVETLRAFSSGVIEHHTGSLEGCDIEEIAVKHGLLELHNVAEPCGEDCACAEVGFPTECYRKTGALASTEPAGQEDMQKREDQE